MLRDRRSDYRQPGRQFPHGLRALGQTRDDRAQGAIRQRAPTVTISVNIH
jgi:hypothetical protein